MNLPKTNQIINVQAYKHNGKLYRQWNGVKVIEISNYNIVLLLFKTKVQESKGSRWIVREPIIWTFSWKGFYNTMVLVRKIGIYYYTNIACPPIYEDKTLKFIDYDLDIKTHLNSNPRVIDYQEFKTNSRLFKYSKNLIKLLKSALKEVLDLIKYNEDFFDQEMIDSFINKLVNKSILDPKYWR